MSALQEMLGSIICSPNTKSMEMTGTATWKVTNIKGQELYISKGISEPIDEGDSIFLSVFHTFNPVTGKHTKFRGTVSLLYSLRGLFDR